MTEENFEDISLYKNIKKLLKHFYNSIKNNDYNKFNICLSNLETINKSMKTQYGGDLNLNNEMLKNKIIQKINMLSKQSNINNYNMTGGSLSEDIIRLKQKIMNGIASLKMGGPGIDLTKIKNDLAQMNLYIRTLADLQKELEIAKLTAESKLSLNRDQLSALQTQINGINIVDLQTLESQLKLFKENIETIVDPKQTLEAYSTMETACRNYYEPTKQNIIIPEAPPGKPVLQLEPSVAPGTPGTPGTSGTSVV